MRKYKVTAEARLQVAVWVDAEDENQAMDQAKFIDDSEFEDDGEIEVIEIKKAEEVQWKTN